MHRYVPLLVVVKGIFLCSLLIFLQSKKKNYIKGDEVLGHLITILYLASYFCSLLGRTEGHSILGAILFQLLLACLSTGCRFEQSCYLTYSKMRSYLHSFIISFRTEYYIYGIIFN